MRLRIIKQDRFVVNYGKYGAFFYDTQEFEQLSLEKVKDYLNGYDYYKKEHLKKKGLID